MQHHAFGFESVAARAPRGPNLCPTASCFSSSAVNLTMPPGDRYKQGRREATRYEKRADHFLAVVSLASIMLWL